MSQTALFMGHLCRYNQQSAPQMWEDSIDVSCQSAPQMREDSIDVSCSSIRRLCWQLGTCVWNASFTRRLCWYRPFVCQLWEDCHRLLIICLSNVPSCEKVVLIVEIFVSQIPFHFYEIAVLIWILMWFPFLLW